MQRKRKALARVGVLLLVLLLMTACAPAASMRNPGLESGGGQGQPKDWQVKSYANQFSIATEGGVVMLHSDVADDLRVVQSVKVKPNKPYVFSAEMRIENVEGTGAGLSIDNYELDKSCVYSWRGTGTLDWVRVELAFMTGPDTKEAVLALRLGGYSEATSGTAYFRNINLEQTGESYANFQLLEPWEQNTPVERTRSSHWYQAVFSLFIMITLLFGMLFLVGIQPNIGRINSVKWDKGMFGALLGGSLLIALLARVLLTVVFRGHPTDITCWIGWGNTVAMRGLAALYEGWCDYPPGYMLIIGLISKVQGFLKINSYGTFGLFGYMLPAILADIGIAFFVMKAAEKQGFGVGMQYFLFIFVMLNPAAMFLSGAWGQIDSILTLLLILSFYSLYRNRRVPSGLFYGLALLMKWQALMFGPVLAVAFLLSIRWKERELRWRDIIYTALAVLAALALVFAVSLFGMGQQHPFWFVERFIDAQSGYNYLSVEAYNARAIFGGNWKQLPELELIITQLIGGDSTLLRADPRGVVQLLLGWLAIAGAVVGGGWMLIKEAKRGKWDLFARRGSLYLAAAFCMYMIFTFGHYMHERYVFPVLFLLVLAYIHYKDRRLLLCAMLLTLSTFLNVSTALYIHMPNATHIVRGQADHNMVVRFCSILETAFFLHFAWVCYDMNRRAKTEIETEAEVPELTNELEGVPI
ncbi:MAG: hypothetical protein FWF10_11035 [Clostridiales bacterium]|nr:hypothetical protein [Clostridiales bacterium]